MEVEIDEEARCPICQEDITNGSKTTIKMGCCGGEMHMDCMLQSTVTETACMLCRTPIPSAEMLRRGPTRAQLQEAQDAALAITIVGSDGGHDVVLQPQTFVVEKFSKNRNPYHHLCWSSSGWLSR